MKTSEASRQAAHYAVSYAVKTGKLVRPNRCQICRRKRLHIVAHHWKGYDHPLDVWWVCKPCNRVLAHRHDGSFTLVQARAYVAAGVWRSRPIEPPSPSVRRIDFSKRHQPPPEDLALFRSLFRQRPSDIASTSP